MPGSLRELLWDDWNEAHVARHSVTPEEVEQVCFGGPWLLRAKGKDKRVAYGQASAGRYLVIILAHRSGGLFYAVTAREMTPTERRRYREWRGR